MTAQRALRIDMLQRVQQHRLSANVGATLLLQLPRAIGASVEPDPPESSIRRRARRASPRVILRQHGPVDRVATTDGVSRPRQPTAPDPAVQTGARRRADRAPQPRRCGRRPEGNAVDMRYEWLVGR